MPVDAYHYDVFMVHSNADQDDVEFLAQKLRNAGVPPFLAAWHLVPGTERQEGLEQALTTSRTCAVFLGAG